MSKAHRKSTTGRAGRERHISVRAVRRNPPDLRKLSRAVIQLAMEQAAAEAAAQADAAAQLQAAEPGTEQADA
jgi:hypothetical protein